jgi:hypothetical protein
LIIPYPPALALYPRPRRAAPGRQLRD